MIGTLIPIIPTDQIPIIPPELDGSQPRRVTLLHKHNDTLVCLHSRGMEEVEYEKPIEDALVVSMYGKDNVFVSYKPKMTLVPRENGLREDRVYTLTEIESGLKGDIETKLIPHERPKEFPSEFVTKGEGLDGKIDELLTSTNEYIRTYCESVADLGFIRGFFFGSNELKEVRKKKKEVGKAVYEQITGLFHEERDHEPVRKHDLLVHDMKLKRFVEDPRKLSMKLKALGLFAGFLVPMLTLLPTSTITLLETEMREKYKKRFERIEDEQEQQAVALGEYIFGNPKLLSGIRRGFYEAKRMSDIGLYSLQVAANLYILNNWSPWIAIPLTIPTLATGITMVKNAINSSGMDWSGMLSSLAEKTATEKIRKKEFEEKYKK